MLDLGAIRVPHSGTSGSIGSIGSGNGGNGGGLARLGGSSVQQNLNSIGINDDPAMVWEAFFKNPDQLALVTDFLLKRIDISFSKLQIDSTLNFYAIVQLKLNNPSLADASMSWKSNRT